MASVKSGAMFVLESYIFKIISWCVLLNHENWKCSKSDDNNFKTNNVNKYRANEQRALCDLNYYYYFDGKLLLLIKTKRIQIDLNLILKENAGKFSHMKRIP